jgi:uncharacterized lipoprotein YbaY
MNGFMRQTRPMRVWITILRSLCPVAMLFVSSGSVVIADEARTRDDAGWGTTGTQMSYLRPTPPRPGGYRLGINIQNLPVGVQVIEVGPNSIAKSAGLEPGDTIVAVGGYQVGYVGERLFDLGDEIARRIDPSESVTFLVRSGRTGSLSNVPVKFASGTHAVSGRLLSDGRVRLPASGVVIVRVLDITYPQWENVSVVQTQLPAGEFPMNYQLVLPALTAGHRYAVDARGEHGGRIVMQTGLPTPLASVDRDQQVDLVLLAPSAAGDSSGLMAVAKPATAASPSGLTPVTPSPSTSLQPRDQIDQWIRSYLGRPPRAFETDVWVAELMRGRSLSSVQAGILSSSEFFERTSRNPDLYVAEVYRLLTGVQPTPAQVTDLRARYDKALGVRLQFVEGLIPPSR